MKPIAHVFSNALRHAAAAKGVAVRESVRATPAFSHFKRDLTKLAEKFLGNGGSGPGVAARGESAPQRGLLFHPRFSSNRAGPDPRSSAFISDKIEGDTGDAGLASPGRVASAESEDS